MTKKKNTTKTTWTDPDDAPQLSAAWFKKADLYHGKTIVRRGRPPKAQKKVPLHMRVDADVMEALRAKGKGWQTIVNDMLRQWTHTSK